MTGPSALFVPDVRIAADQAAFSELSAAFFIASIEKLKAPLVVLPTGNTPLGMYDVLATQYAGRRDLWDNMRFLALDEYAGLARNDSRLFSGWLCRVFLDRVGIPAANRTFFQSDAANRAQEIVRMETFLNDNGPVDLAVLGLGANGHLGMNEPGSPFDGSTRLITLTPETIKSGAAYWGSEAAVPREAYSLGLGGLLKAKEIMLLVNGAAKAGILAETLNGAVGPAIPATCLRTRGGVRVIADRDAAGKLTP